MAPGVNGRQTGTVPKTKPENDSSRDVVWQSRRDQSYNNKQPCDYSCHNISAFPI